ncbi:ABC transporter [Williamsia sp. 1138]|uniref:ABC transporter ATP-binding protein n=1 Tax=Williamsia sp. 1138 TaxID=1903117 RepID=UPI000A0F6071|nr:ABC transporter ATP-binding protein [Williamsia sp. 1138]OZG26180.1 ABC transporter [Williamsia sp. 1138]
MTSFAPVHPPQAPVSRPALRLDNVTKSYGSGSARVTALDAVSLALPAQGFTAIMGPSGSGKSTFLHCAAGLDQPTSGSVWMGDTEISALKPKARTMFRRDHVGFVFQAYNLMSSLTVEQNVTLPLLLAGRTADRGHVGQILESVGLSRMNRRRPAELSGGQQQRVAIARALVTRPGVIFADEPTGALDSRTGQQILTLLGGASRELGQTVVMVTHDPIAAARADRVLFLAGGRFAGHLDAPTAGAIEKSLTDLGQW